MSKGEEQFCGCCRANKRLKVIEHKLDELVDQKRNPDMNPIDSIKDQYIKKHDLMEWLGVKTTWIWEKEKSGDLVPYKVSKRAVFYKKADVLLLIDKSRVNNF